MVIRFLGTTPYSSNIRSLLKSVSEQISLVYGATYTETSDFSQMIKQFHLLLNHSNDTKPLILIFDSIDQLSPEDGAYKLSWLPFTLPKHTYVLMSTLTEEYGILNNLKERIPNAHYNPLKVLGGQLAIDIVKLWLKGSKRTLSEEQEKYLSKIFSMCSLPIFVKLAFDKAVTWKSFQKINAERRSDNIFKKVKVMSNPGKKEINSIEIPETVQGAIRQLFRKLEIKYGKLFVSRALGYLTCNPQGLSELEMQDVLSLDDDVLGEVFQYHIPPVRRIPSFLWARLRHSISPYLAEREAHGTSVHFWYHRQFIEVAANEYVKTQKKILHKNLSEFYSGLWYKRPKPFQFTKEQVKHFKLKSNTGSAIRNVPNQPIIFEHDDNINFNQRKLHFLPYHYALSEQFNCLFNECLFNYEWLKYKLKATGPHNLLEDFKLGSDVDDECMLLYNSLSSVRNFLLTHPETLSVEIIGRLYDLAGDKRLKLKSLINQCLQTKDCCLKPLHQCYPGPGGANLFSLQHNNLRPGENVIFSSSERKRLSTITDYNDLVVWDLETGEIEKEIALPSLTNDGFSFKLSVSYLDRSQKVLTLAAPFHNDINRIYQLNIESCDIIRTIDLSKTFPSVGFVTNMKIWCQNDILLIFIRKKTLSKFNLINGKLENEIETNSNYFNVDNVENFVLLSAENRLDIVKLDDLTIFKTINMDLSLIFRTIYHQQTNFLYIINNDHIINILSGDLKNYGENIDKIDLRKLITKEKVRDHLVHENWLFLIFELTILVWNLMMNKLVTKFKIPNNIVNYYQHSLKHSLNGYQVFNEDKLIVGFENHLFIWNISKNKLIFSSILSKLTIDNVFTTSVEDLFAFNSLKGRNIEVWSYKKLLQGNIQIEPLNLKWFCRYIMCSKSLTPLAVTRGKSTETKVWDAESCRILSTPALIYENAENYFTTPPILSYDGSNVVTRDWVIGKPASLNIWDSRSGRHQWSIPIDAARLKRYSLQISRTNSRVLLTHLETSPDKDVLTTAWDIKKRSKILDFPNEFGGFSYIEVTTNDYAIFLQQYPQTADGRSCKILVYNLEGDEIFSKTNILKDSLSVIPDSDAFYAVETQPEMHLRKFTLMKDGVNERPLTICPNGNLNVSLDGRKGIDIKCFVYDLDKSKTICQFESGNDKKDVLSPHTYPRLTGDGAKAVWLSITNSQLAIGCTVTKTIIGRLHTYSTPLSFDITLNDTVVIGCQDGKVSFVKIKDKNAEVEYRFKKSTVCVIL